MSQEPVSHQVVSSQQLAERPTSEFEDVVTVRSINWSGWDAVFASASRDEQMAALERLAPLVLPLPNQFPFDQERADIESLFALGATSPELSDRLERYNNAISMAGGGGTHIDVAEVLSRE